MMIHHADSEVMTRRRPDGNSQIFPTVFGLGKSVQLKESSIAKALSLLGQEAVLLDLLRHRHSFAEIWDFPFLSPKKSAAELCGFLDSKKIKSVFRFSFVVKRIRDMNKLAHEPFDVEMRRLGKLQTNGW